MLLPEEGGRVDVELVAGAVIRGVSARRAADQLPVVTQPVNILTLYSNYVIYTIYVIIHDCDYLEDVELI